jgi:hypothetical protein
MPALIHILSYATKVDEITVKAANSFIHLGIGCMT